MTRPPTTLFRQTLALVAGLALVAFSGLSRADPPGRVARLGYLSGEVSFSPAGEDDWGSATLNRPLGPGDRLWADANGRAEIQVGGAMLRLNSATAVSVLNLDDDIAQLQLTEGSLNVRVRRLEQGQSVEVDTPNLAFTLRQPGAYRIDVDPDGNTTTVRMREGEGEITGESGSYLIEAPQVQRFSGDAMRDEGDASAPPPDDFDRWAGDRDRVVTASVSARYVSPDVVGYEDLDANGDWADDPGHGHVWYPRHVTRDWAPYRDGHWAWIDPWGWTWVDDAPWGFAVSHYGRWAHIRGRWGWVPGPVRTRAYYAPALVVFVGGPSFSLRISSGGGGGVAWFPLGPREVYHPAYRVSPRYFEQVNISNTVVNKTVIKNVYVTKNVTHVTYVNRRVPGAVVAVQQDTFKNAQPVAKATIRVSKETLDSREVHNAAPIAPTEKSLRGPSGPTAQAGKPPPRVFARQVVARTAPPPARPSFAAQQAKLAAQPGRPLDDAQREEVVKARPVAHAASAATPHTAPVKVVAAKPGAAKILPAPAARASEARAAGDDRAAASAPAAPPVAPTTSASAPRTAAQRKAERQAMPASAASAAERDAPASAARPGRAASAADRAAARANKPPAAASAAAARRAASAPASRPSPLTDEGRSPPPAPRAASAPTRTVEERQAARAAQRERAAAKARANEAAPASPTAAPPATSASEPEPAASHPKRRKP
ncbi:DUF6600 domain-containing protein [Ideonella sp.]|uniref:DUF6600 domain-containing protein n=1 Tax=Ideonella sp. TaxID=1929293 RepID=UPI0035B27FA1